MEARPRVIAALAAHFRDLDMAEDCFAEACEALLRQTEPPERPVAWLLTVGKRKGIDAIRKRQTAESVADEMSAVSDMADVLTLPEAIPDERLRLIFICSHPSIALETRTALALKVICGLPVAEIARVFLTSEQSMYQRITRAKAKIREAGIAFELPPRKAWAERLDAVLLTLELAYTVTYQDAAQARDNELAAEVARLASMLAELLPQEGEALGLAALVALARSRESARVGAEGAMIPLSQQDTGLWDRAAIEQARQWLDQAAALSQSGPYQLMAVIQLTHARRAFDGATDWAAILALYDALMVVRPSAVVALNRVMALAKVEGEAKALAELEQLPEEKLSGMRPYHVARAELLEGLGRPEEAIAALNRASELDPNPAERLFLEGRLRRLRSAQSTLRSVE